MPKIEKSGQGMKTAFQDLKNIRAACHNDTMHLITGDSANETTTDQQRAINNSTSRRVDGA